MGLLQQGDWVDQWYDTEKSGGRFERQQSAFRHWVTVDGQAGPSGDGGFTAEAGRYHLYVSLACPWAHRTLMMRTLKGLEGAIGMTVVDPLMLENGWEFSASDDDDCYGLNYLYQLYLKADPHYEGRVTVPVLWDKERGTIVNNESSEIIRMLNSAFDHCADTSRDLYPMLWRAGIDTMNDWVYDTINNGVYKAGFATQQAVYEEAVSTLFDALDQLELRLSEHRYLMGDCFTEADIRLFTTLIRFDAVYVGHFKCNLRTLQSYPNLSGYVREIYQLPGVAETVNFEHIKTHYYGSHKSINPTGIVPLGPILDLQRAHGRDQLVGVD